MLVSRRSGAARGAGAPLARRRSGTHRAPHWRRSSAIRNTPWNGWSPRPAAVRYMCRRAPTSPGSAHLVQGVKASIVGAAPRLAAQRSGDASARGVYVCLPRAHEARALLGLLAGGAAANAPHAHCRAVVVASVGRPPWTYLRPPFLPWPLHRGHAPSPSMALSCLEG